MDKVFNISTNLGNRKIIINCDFKFYNFGFLINLEIKLFTKCYSTRNHMILTMLYGLIAFEEYSNRRNRIASIYNTIYTV